MNDAITHTLKDGYHVYQVGGDVDFYDIFIRFRNGSLKGKRLANAARERDVYLLEDGGRRFVLKWDHGGWGFGGEGRLERFFWRVVRGPYYSRLLRRVDRAWQNGCHAMQRVFMVAERRTLHYPHEAAVLLEYIEGHEIGADWPRYTDGVTACIQSLHANGLAVCDVNEHNFLVTPDGIRAIDLVCRGNPRLDRMKDVVRAKRIFNIDLPVRGVLDTIVHRGLTLFQDLRSRHVARKRARRQLTREKKFRGGK